MKVQVHSEFMRNQVGAQTVKPDKLFDVIQTPDGLALQFSIADDDGRLRVTHEHAQSPTGWSEIDLSSRIHPDRNDVRVKTFTISQNAYAGQQMRFDMILALTLNNVDEVYISRDISVDSTASWADSLSWMKVDWTAESGQAPPWISVSQVYALNSTYSAQNNDDDDDDDDDSGSSVTNFNTMFVDLFKIGNPLKEIKRYWIKSTQTTAIWMEHDLPQDASADQLQSCIGCRPQSIFHDNCGGLYTFSGVGLERSLVYTPQHSKSDPNFHGDSVELQLQQGSSAIASAPLNDGSGATNLYLAAQGGLFLYPADKQHADAEAISVYPANTNLDKQLFLDVLDMVADTINGRTVVWCRNSDKHLFYLSCPLGKETTKSEWSVPIPIAANVDSFAFYINRTTTNNTVFVANYSAGTLRKRTQESDTSIWHEVPLSLPTTDRSQMTEHPSFTTQIKIYDDQGSAVSSAKVTITPSTRMEAFINNVHYTLQADKSVPITADRSGGVNLVESVSSFAGSCFSVTTSDGVATLVNPTDTAYAKLGAPSAEKLKNQTIPDSQGNRNMLISPGSVSDVDLDTAAKTLQNLLTAKASVPKDGRPQPSSGSSLQMEKLATRQSASSSLAHPQIRMGGFFDVFVKAVGDLVTGGVHLIEKVEHAAVEFVEDGAEKAWHLVVTIAGTVYRGILNSLSAVSQAAQFIFNKIKVVIDQIIAWLGFLFEWPDIVFTHKVMKGIFRNYAAHAVTDGFKFVKSSMDSIFDSLDSEIQSVTKAPKIQSPQTFGAQSQSTSSNSSFNSPQAHWGVNQMHSNLPSGYTGHQAGEIAGDTLEGLLNNLLEAVKDEVDDVKATVLAIKSQVIDKLNSLTPIDAALQTLGLLGELLVKSGKNLLDHLLDALELIIEATLALLDAEIELPVISNIYKEFVGDKLTFLDLVCLVCAIPVTVIVKAVKHDGSAPFSRSDPAANQIINATSWAQVQAALRPSPPLKLSGAKANIKTQTAHELAALPAGVNADLLNIATYSLNLGAYIGAILVDITYGLKLAVKDGEEPSTLLLWASIACWLPYAAPNVTGAIPDPSGWSTITNDVVTGIAFLKVLLDNTPKVYRIKGYNGLISPFIDTLLNRVWLVPAIAGIIAADKSVESNWWTFGANVAFDVGGIIAPAASQDVVTEDFAWIGQGAVLLCNGAYGVGMLGAGLLQIDGK